MVMVISVIIEEVVLNYDKFFFVISLYRIKLIILFGCILVNLIKNIGVIKIVYIMFVIVRLMIK